MGFLEANLEALAKIDPELVQRLSGTQDSPRIQPIDENSFTVSTGDGQGVLFSDGKPDKSIPKLSGFGHLKDSDVVIVYGFGIGTHVRELIQSTSPKTFILVIDPALDLFHHALKLNDLRQTFETSRLSLSIGEEPYKATRVRLENYFGVFTLKNIKVFHCQPAVKLATPYFTEVERCIKEVSRIAETNRLTLSRFSVVWHRHILENLPEILDCPGIASLAGKFSGKPAIIISAGPSLDKNIKWLASAKGRAVLICVDSALKTLLKNGIVPDFFVCLDAVEVNFKHVAGEKTDDICMLANPVTFPQILKNHKGRIFMMTFNDPLMEWIERSIGEKGIAVTGGSVATAAYDFARQINARPICLVGQDLAFTARRAYASGSFYDDSWYQRYDGGMVIADFQRGKMEMESPVPGKDCMGHETFTSPKMANWKRWFETMIARESGRCVHATEGGLMINGASVQQLRETIFQNCGEAFTVDQVLETIDFQPDPKSLEDLFHRMRDLEKKIQKIEKKCREALSMTTRLLVQTKKKGPERQKLQDGMARLGNVASAILSEEEFLQLNKWSIDVLIEKMQEFKSKSKNTPIHTSLNSYQILLGGIADICKDFGGKLNHSVSFLEERIAGD